MNRLMRHRGFTESSVKSKGAAAGRDSFGDDAGTAASAASASNPSTPKGDSTPNSPSVEALSRRRTTLDDSANVEVLLPLVQCLIEPPFSVMSALWDLTVAEDRARLRYWFYNFALDVGVVRRIGIFFPLPSPLFPNFFSNLRNDSFFEFYPMRSLIINCLGWLGLRELDESNSFFFQIPPLLTLQLFHFYGALLSQDIETGKRKKKGQIFE